MFEGRPICVYIENSDDFFFFSNLEHYMIAVNCSHSSHLHLHLGMQRRSDMYTKGLPIKCRYEIKKFKSYSELYEFFN